MRWHVSAVTAQELRKEIFELGGRHFGEPLAGALLELGDLNLTQDRRRLLQAVVNELKPAHQS
jgi:hypothetical protein